MDANCKYILLNTFFKTGEYFIRFKDFQKSRLADQDHSHSGHQIKRKERKKKKENRKEKREEKKKKKEKKEKRKKWKLKKKK